MEQPQIQSKTKEIVQHLLKMKKMLELERNYLHDILSFHKYMLTPPLDFDFTHKIKPINYTIIEEVYNKLYACYDRPVDERIQIVSQEYDKVLHYLCMYCNHNMIKDYIEAPYQYENLQEICYCSICECDESFIDSKKVIERVSETESELLCDLYHLEPSRESYEISSDTETSTSSS